ncbi:hypothetical protein FACS189445_6990 [Spirochaetia bacterium]|nr:hypothetical protein FACS189445_6990 [Spirochaetia bacterium]
MSNDVVEQVRSVMVYIQQDSGNLAEVSLELVSKARELADKLGVGVGAVLFGEKVAQEVPRLASLGADTVYLYEEPKLKHYTPIPYTKLMIGVITEYKPQIVLYGATTTGRDLAPRVASYLKVGLTADCTDLQIGDHAVKGPGAGWPRKCRRRCRAWAARLCRSAPPGGPCR